MVLHKVVLNNFKSYKGIHTLGPFDSFSCIVGPNGSGKSNLMDAVCFALTVNSTFLRASNLQELINNDCDNAFVEVFLTNNSKKEHITVSGDNQIVLKRSINNKGISIYYTNNKPVSYTEYVDFLHTINIYPKSKNFLIFQGEIDSISLKEPKEMTKMIEEISGSIKYRKDYESAEERMNLLFSECQKMFEKRKEINGRLKEIAESKEQERKIREKIRMKDEIYSKIKMCDIKMKNEEMKKIEIDIERLNKQKDVVKNKMKEINMEDETTSLNLYKKIMELENEIENIMFEIKEANRKNLNAEIEQENKVHLIKKIDEIKKLIENKNIKISKIENEIKSVKNLHDSEITQIEKKYEKYTMTQEVINEFYKLERTYQNSVKGITTEIGELDLQIKPINARIKMLESNNSDLNNNIVRFENEIQNIKTGVECAEYKLKMNKASINVIRAKQKEGLDTYQDIVTEENALNEKLGTCIKEILHIKNEQRESDRQLKIHDCIEQLKLNLNGVHGKVIDLVSTTQKKYETPISVLMSGFDEAVIVEDDKTAIKCINYVKENKVGRITFLPLSSLKYEEPDYNHRKHGIMAVDTINYDKKIQNAIFFILGNSLITKQTSEAKHLIYNQNLRFKICTLDGILFHRNGNITGGKISNKFTDNNLSKLLTLKNEIMGQLQNIKIKKGSYSHIEAANEKILTLEKDNSELEKYLDQENTKRAFLEDRLEKIHATIKESAEEITRLKSEILSATKKRADLQNELEKQETIIFKNFVYADSMKDFKYILENGKDVKSEKLTEINKIINRLTEECDFLQADVTKLKMDLEITEKHLFMLTQSYCDKNSMINLKHCLDVKRKNLEELKNKHNQNRHQTNELRKEFKKLMTELSAADNKVNEEMKRFLKVKDDLLGLVKMAVLEEITFPPTMDQAISTNLFTIEMDEDMIIENIKKIDFSKISEDPNTYESQYKQILKEIEDNMPILLSKDTSKNHTNYGKINSDYEELRKEALLAKEDFNKIKTKRINAFMACYNVISQSIGNIYQELTKRDDNEGNAYLLLENNTEPYKGGLKFFAMPPTKRYREMQALSGGEKTMAALALLFSIHAYKPSPFYLFDEMDSALDKTNVTSIVEYISKSDVQFIIITLKLSFFQHADGLVGIYKNAGTSKVLTYRFD